MFCHLNKITEQMAQINFHFPRKVKKYRWFIFTPGSVKVIFHKRQPTYNVWQIQWITDFFPGCAFVHITPAVPQLQLFCDTRWAKSNSGKFPMSFYLQLNFRIFNQIGSVVIVDLTCQIEGGLFGEVSWLCQKQDQRMDIREGFIFSF